jgi:hypothetical protein
VLSVESNTTCEFFAGDGIEDVLASRDTIVVTYFDEGVFGGPPGNEGLAIFETSGELRAGYISTLASDAVAIADVYAACWESNSRVAFCPYDCFPFVSLDVSTMEQKVYTTTECLHGSTAISVSLDAILFHRGGDILAWTPGCEPSLVGHHSGRLRGLFGGRFLVHDVSGFTIIEAVKPDITADSESPLRNLMAQRGSMPYCPLSSLEAAQLDPHGIVVLEGDNGGQIYVVSPITYVLCSGEALELLLMALDERSWPVNGWDMWDRRRVYFESKPTGQRIPGGIGGGEVIDGVWIHPDLIAKGFAGAIKEVLSGTCLTLREGLRKEAADKKAGKNTRGWRRLWK